MVVVWRAAHGVPFVIARLSRRTRVAPAGETVTAILKQRAEATELEAVNVAGGAVDGSD